MLSTAPLTNRDRLVAQARRLFAENGYAAVSVDEVAAAAGLTKGAVYYQFKDKTDLFRAACDAVMLAANASTAMAHCQRMRAPAPARARSFIANLKIEKWTWLQMQQPVQSAC